MYHSSKLFIIPFVITMHIPFFFYCNRFNHIIFSFAFPFLYLLANLYYLIFVFPFVGYVFCYIFSCQPYSDKYNFINWSNRYPINSLLIPMYEYHKIMCRNDPSYQWNYSELTMFVIINSIFIILISFLIIYYQYTVMVINKFLLSFTVDFNILYHY